MSDVKAIDIETIPNEQIISMLPEPEVALGNTKDPTKIEEKRKEAKQKQIDDMAKSPMTGRICSFSLCSTTEKYFKVIPEISDAAEIELINHILDRFCLGVSQETNTFTTWNGFSFDFPFIYKRAALLKIALRGGCPALSYWTRKYSHSPHCDLMMEWTGWQIAKNSNLDFIGKMILGRGKTERDYSTYVDLIKSGKGELIGLDNLCDTELTFDLYNFLNPYLF